MDNKFYNNASVQRRVIKQNKLQILYFIKWGDEGEKNRLYFG